jgi:hypothetical protein
MTMRRALIVFLLALTGAAACGGDGCTSSTQEEGEGALAPREQERGSRHQRVAEVVARVAGEPILGEEIEPTGRLGDPAKLADARRRYLENVINERVLRLEAERLMLRLTPRELAEAHAHEPRAGEMAAFLTRLGKTREEYAREVEERRLFQKLRDQEVGGTLTVTEEEIRAEFHAHRDRYPRFAGARLRQKFLPLGAEVPEEEARRARLRLRDEVMRQAQGKTPARMAEEFGDELGLLTYAPGANGFGDGVLAHRALREAVDRLAPGQLSPILRGPDGLHVFYVVARQEAGAGTLEDARQRIESALYQRKYQEELERWMAGLWERYEVQVFLK